MAPRKSNESEKEKNEYSSENEADVSNSNNEEDDENEPIKKSSKANGQESSMEKNGKAEDEVDADEAEDVPEDDQANGDQDDVEDDDDEAPIKKRKITKEKAKPAAKKKKSVAAKTTPKKKKAAAKNQVEEDDEKAEEEYEVKEVIDSKKEKNVLYYLIRWKGYTAADDTWERATDLSCDDLIAVFNKKIQNKKTTPATKQIPKKRKKEEDVDPEKEYEVEKIISMVENKKGNVFRIRWKGFKSTQDTWEPEANLNCKDLIEKFLKKHKEQSQYSSKSLREEPKRTKRLLNETKNPRSRSSKRSSVKARKTYYSEDDDSE